MTSDRGSTSDALIGAHVLAERYATLANVRAIALGGSHAAGTADAASDIDLYIYTTAAVSVRQRSALAVADARAEINNRWFGIEDAWTDSSTGCVVDVVWRQVAWIENELNRVLIRHQARVGYSTCKWANVLASQPLVDQTGWYSRLQQRAGQPYPEPLRRAIIGLNLPLLRKSYSAYVHQLEKAIARGDLVSVNHRVAALIASYFDVLFALNRIPHPGEKRLVNFALNHCLVLPSAMPEQIDGLLRAAGEPGLGALTWAEMLCAGLERLVEEHL